MSASFSRQPSKLIIESVVPLTEGQTSTILSNLALADQNIEVENVASPALIGGLRISYQGKVLDLSLLNQLNQLKEETHE